MRARARDYEGSRLKPRLHCRMENDPAENVRSREHARLIRRGWAVGCGEYRRFRQEIRSRGFSRKALRFAGSCAERLKPRAEQSPSRCGPMANPSLAAALEAFPEAIAIHLNCPYTAVARSSVMAAARTSPPLQPANRTRILRQACVLKRGTPKTA